MQINPFSNAQVVLISFQIAKISQFLERIAGIMSQKILGTPSLWP